MAEAIIGSYNPETGERKESTWQYQPVVQRPNPSIRAPDQPVNIWTPERANALLLYTAQVNPKAVPALYARIQSEMAKQSAVKPVNPLDEIRLETAKVNLNSAKQKYDDAVRKSLAPPTSNLPVEWQRDPNKVYITKGGAVVPPVSDKSQGLSPMMAATLLSNIQKVGSPLSTSQLTNDIPALVSTVRGGISGKAGQGVVAAPTAPASGSGKPYKRFASEKDATKEGYQAGDIIYLEGVGKVRLK